jgi:hypothetical protein
MIKIETHVPKTTKIRYNTIWDFYKDSGKKWFSRCKNNDSDAQTSDNSSKSIGLKTSDDSRDAKFISLQTFLKGDFNTESGAVIVRFVDKDGFNHFTRFDTFDKLMHLMNRLEDCYKNIHEVILGNYTQKIRFDIDFEYSIDSDSNEKIIESYFVLVNCIRACYHFFSSSNCVININDPEQKCQNQMEFLSGFFQFVNDHVIVCTSNRIGKCSYHIIINGFYAVNSTHAKTIADMIIEKISPEFRKSIDAGIYKSFQHLRILGGTKKIILPDGRVKYSSLDYIKNLPDICEFVLKNEFPEADMKSLKNYENTKKYINSFYELFKSCLVSYTIGSKCLNFIPEKKVIAKTNIPKHIIEESIVQFKRYLEETKSNLKFKVGTVVEGIITIKRLKASLCPICKRTHDAENPFIYILSKEPNYYFYYNCRRHDNTVPNLKFGSVSNDIQCFKKHFDFGEINKIEDKEWFVSDIQVGEFTDVELIDSDVISEDSKYESDAKLSKILEEELLKDELLVDLEYDSKLKIVESKKVESKKIESKKIEQPKKHVPKFKIKQENIMDY